jgi:transcriptional regulator with XRE-family HTH domain
MLIGARKLAQAGGTQQEKADRLGVKQQTVSGWLAAGVVPNGKQLLMIEREYGIPVGDWLAEDEDEPSTERAT